MESATVDLQRPGHSQDDCRCLGRVAALSKSPGERSHFGQRCSCVECYGFRALRSADVAARCAAHPALPGDADRNADGPARTTVGCAGCAGVEPASMKDRRVFLGAALAIVGLPAAIVPIEAVSFYS